MRYTQYCLGSNLFQHLKKIPKRVRDDAHGWSIPDERRVRSPNVIGQYHHILAAIMLNLTFFTPHAHAQGLEKAKGVLEIIKTEILGIVPLVAVIALIGLGIGYAMNSVQKETFVRWAVGLIIIGSAAQITKMLLG